MTKQELEYMKDNTKVSVHEDNGRLFVKMSTPKIDHLKNIATINFQFYIDNIEIKPIDGSGGYGWNDYLYRDDRVRGITFHMKEDDKGELYSIENRGKMMSLEDIEKELGHKVILKNN